MSHEVHNGQAVYAKKPAWHGLGVTLADTFTAAEALRHLDPENEPIQSWIAAVIDPITGEVHTTEDFKGTVQIQNGKVVVFDFPTPEYGIVQLVDQFAWADELVGQVGGAHYEAAVKLRGGKQVIMTVALGEHILDPNGRGDKQYSKLFLANSWNRSWAFMAKATNVRAECANMAAMVMGQHSPEIKLRHTVNIMDRVNVAREALGMVVEHDKLFFEVAEALIEKDMSDNQFQRILDTVFTVEDSGTTEKDEEAIATVRGIYELNPTQINVFGTYWGGFNAISYFNDWNTAVRGGKHTTVGESRLLRQVDDTKGLKQRAWDIIREKAEV